MRLLAITDASRAVKDRVQEEKRGEERRLGHLSADERRTLRVLGRLSPGSGQPG